LDARLWHFAILTSRMHMAWMRTVTGRMKSDYMYSVGVVYNPFPWPDGLAENPKTQNALETLARSILDARAAFPDSTLAQLYDPVTMPPALRRAHSTLDTAVERLYSRTGFTSDAARVAHLFARYAQLVQRQSSLLSETPPRPRKRRAPVRIHAAARSQNTGVLSAGSTGDIG